MRLGERVDRAFAGKCWCTPSLDEIWAEFLRAHRRWTRDQELVRNRREWLRLERHKQRARNLTQNMRKKAGVQPLPCPCGATKVHMHHVDYDQPYLIAFLCVTCHRREHTGKLAHKFELHDLRDLAVADRVAFP
jgi:hypothetical protein